MSAVLALVALGTGVSSLGATVEETLEGTYARLCAASKAPSETCIALKRALVEKLTGSSASQEAPRPASNVYDPPATRYGIFGHLADKGEWKSFNQNGGVLITRWMFDPIGNFVTSTNGTGSADADSYQSVFKITGTNTGESCLWKDRQKSSCTQFTFTETSFTYLFTDVDLSSKMQLISPDIAVTLFKADGVEVKSGSFSKVTFDADPKVREMALQSMEQSKIAFAQRERNRKARHAAEDAEIEAASARDEQAAADKAAKASRDWQPVLDALSSFGKK